MGPVEIPCLGKDEGGGLLGIPEVSGDSVALSLADNPGWVAGIFSKWCPVCCCDCDISGFGGLPQWTVPGELGSCTGCWLGTSDLEVAML